MAREIIATEAAPKAPPAYSQAVRAAGLIFVSGTAPIDPATGRLVEGPVQAQVAQCLRNIAAILEAAGSSLQKSVSATLIPEHDDNRSTDLLSESYSNFNVRRRIQRSGRSDLIASGSTRRG